MSWTLLAGLLLVLGTALLLAWHRRQQLTAMHGVVRERADAERLGSSKAQLQYPVIDLSRCLGCGACIKACPEEGVLELVHGQAMVVHGARCVGVGNCARECPVSAITVTLGDAAERDDIPALRPDLQAIGSDGLYLAGEVTAHALIKTAIDHGAAVADAIAARAATLPPAAGARDLIIVGAGPAGLACALQAKAHGLDFVALEQESAIGGTVAKYPRQKLVLTQPVDLPLVGRLRRTTYAKEELIALWQDAAATHQLPIATGEVLQGVAATSDGHYVVRTQRGEHRARSVCLALGRRGVPNRLGVPGEDLTKVSYGLLDAANHQGRAVLVVGGGDSAVEAAVALGEQPGNTVTLSYRQAQFARIKHKNEQRLGAAVQAGHVRLLLKSRVQAITADAVLLQVDGDGPPRQMRLPNDDVFVLIGGKPPLDLLRQCGVSFDPALRQAAAAQAPGEQGTGVIPALLATLVLTLLTLGFAFWHADYYALSQALRPTHPLHHLLRPGMGLGLGFGIAAALLIVLNLLYLLRRFQKLGFTFGSLRLWMTSHVATGVLAMLCALLHAAMAPRATVGGDAFWALVVLMLTGAVGRYFYAYVPRATNGRELQLAEAKAGLVALAAEWDQGQQQFRARVRDEVTALVERRQWRTSWGGRLLALLGGQRDLRRLLQRLAAEGRNDGVAEDDVAATMALAARAHRAALATAHFEDLRALLGSWRFLHRWFAVLMLLLVLVHIVHALAYGSFFSGGGLG